MIPTSLINLICDYSTEYKLRQELSLYKINWNWLSENDRAVDLLIKNQSKIDWFCLSRNRRFLLLIVNKHN